MTNVFDTDVLQAHRIEHAGWGLTQPWGGRPFDRLPRNALGDEAAQLVQVHQVSEFQTVPKGSAGGKDRISKAQGANLYTEVNAFRRIHCS